MNRRHNFQNIAWFNDLYTRKLLELDPPYQRRSVWNQPYRDYFIDTILLNYPTPAIFLYEEISMEGIAKYNLVDGKQRLTTVFNFINNEFPVSETAVNQDLRGIYFEEFSGDDRISFFNYSFLVEYLPTSDENIINNIFDRINRNVAKLTQQELRHAKYSGEFITVAEDLADWTFKNLSNSFPRIAIQSKKQMKDVELIAQLLLLLEEGPKGYNSNELDKAFSERDFEWEHREKTTKLFKKVVNCLSGILKHNDEHSIAKTRFKNQADFYSLFGAVSNLILEKKLPTINVLYKTLIDFSASIDSKLKREKDKNLEIYYGHARTASNRTSARKERIDVLEKYINKG